MGLMAMVEAVSRNAVRVQSPPAVPYRNFGIQPGVSCRTAPLIDGITDESREDGYGEPYE